MIPVVRIHIVEWQQNWTESVLPAFRDDDLRETREMCGNGGNGSKLEPSRTHLTFLRRLYLYRERDPVEWSFPILDRVLVLRQADTNGGIIRVEHSRHTTRIEAVTVSDGEFLFAAKG